MEKRRPHCSLERVKTLLSEGRFRSTRTALDDARRLGIISVEQMAEVVGNLTPRHFWKSMTTYADGTVWQDVYHFRPAAGGKLYIKLTVIDDVLIVSFKELGS